MNPIEAGNYIEIEQAGFTAPQPLEQPDFLGVPRMIESHSTPNLWRRSLLSAGGLVAALGVVNCGGGGTESNISTVTVESTPISSSTVLVESTPTPIPTATKTPEAAPTVTGPTDASKAKVKEQMPATLTSINADISALQQPLSANIPQETFKQEQGEVAIDITAINEALAKNDITAARKSLIDLKNALYNMRDPFKAVSPTKEMIAAHDPKNKYLQQFDIDPELMKDYLSVIDMLVATDPSY